MVSPEQERRRVIKTNPSFCGSSSLSVPEERTSKLGSVRRPLWKAYLRHPKDKEYKEDREPERME